MDERSQKAFDVATETVKQFLGLATAIVGITVSFSKDILDPAGPGSWPRHLMVAGWVVFLASIVTGTGALMAISGQLGNPKIATPSIYSGNIRLFVSLQVALFLAGVAFVVYAAQQSL